MATFKSTLSKASIRISFLPSVATSGCFSAAFLASSIALRPFFFWFTLILLLINSTSSLTSSRGKIGVPLATTWLLAGKSLKAKSVKLMASSGKPSCRQISFGASGITGWSSAAITRRLFARWVITSESSAFLLSSLASTQGSVSSMYLLARETSFQTAARASAKWVLSISSLYSAIAWAAVSSRSASKAVWASLVP